MGRLRRHYWWSRPRGVLWDAHRVDRDRTLVRLELGERAYRALYDR